jgi:lipopolysaccharide export system permease protein
VLGNRTLGRYLAVRFMLTIFGTFLLCSVLIFMIDFVELLRQSGKYGSVPASLLVWMTLLRLPAYTEILMAFAVQVGTVAALLMLSRKSELAVMRAAGLSVWQFLRPGLMVAPGRGGTALRQGIWPGGELPAQPKCRQLVAAGWAGRSLGLECRSRQQ